MTLGLRSYSTSFNYYVDLPFLGGRIRIALQAYSPLGLSVMALEMTLGSIARRRARYSLRSLLGLTAICSLGLLLFDHSVAGPAREQRRALLAIEKLGGRVTFYTGGGGPDWAPNWARQRYFRQVAAVDLCGSKTANAAIRHLTRLGGVCGLQTIQSIDASFTDIGNDALRYVAHCEGLRFLDLHNCRGLTDDGLGSLHHLHHLRFVTLYRTQVTCDGVKELQGKLPRCQILDRFCFER